MPKQATTTAGGVFSIATLKGGRNGIDPPMLVPDDQVLEAQNVDWYKGGIGRKRPGSDSISLSGGTSPSIPCALFRHLPAGSDETKAELWLIDDVGIFHRLAGGTTWVDVSPKDAVSASVPTNATGMRGIIFNGKLYLLYANSAGRVEVWDGTTLRRTGLAAPSAAPTTSLSGTGVTDTRTYQSAVTKVTGGVTVMRSELSAASSPVSPSNQSVVVTLQGAPGEGETNWELYGASTDGVYKLVGSATIGNTITDNNASLTGTLAPLAGTNSLIPDAVLVAKDGNSRLLFGRHRTTTAFSSRIWFTPILVSAGDDERVPTVVTQSNSFDLSPNDGDFLQGIAGPLQGAMYAYKNNSTWKLTPTGDVTSPYTVLQISTAVGCVCDKSIVAALDEYGQPCLAWMSRLGPHRIGSQGLQYMGRDVEDIWPTINLAATIPCHGIYYPQIHQIWWWLCTGTATDPNVIIVFDTIIGHAMYYYVGDVPPTAGVRRGWAKWTGSLSMARCSTMFAASIGASMGIYNKPYAGLYTSPSTVLRGDSATATDDAGVPYQAYIRTKSYQPVGRMEYVSGTNPVIQAKASQGTVLELQIIPDWGGQQTIKDYVNLTAVSNESRVWKKFEKARVPHCRVMQLQIGDGSATSSAWELDELVMPVYSDGAMS